MKHISVHRLLLILAIIASSLNIVKAEIYFIHNDDLGTPKQITNKNQTVVWEAEHDPFGKATVNEDPDGDGLMITNNLRFPGQYYDQESWLHYNMARYYDPNTGRYITSDPIGLFGGLNTYLYVNANPLIFIDPFGLRRANPWNRF